MTLIKSISGIRGTIGGKISNNLTPIDIVKFTSAYAVWLKKQSGPNDLKVVLGRDARVSGPMVNNIISGTLQANGIDVEDIGLATTPTTEIAVTESKANGGIIITASHNPAQWNALKMLNEKGEFLSAEDGKFILELVEKEGFEYAGYDKMGKYSKNDSYDDIHIDKILQLEYVDVDAIRKAGFKVAIDCVNSVGGVIIPILLNKLGVAEIIKLYCEPNGEFPHNPEPLPEHLTELSSTIKKNKADLGFVVDPDVDRLAIVNEDGSMFGEEYTLVAVSDYILNYKKGGNTVSNMSSTLALHDVTIKHGGKYSASAVGEVNVVEKMKNTNAVIGGEGNGGVILPDLHYGRDALVGIALFLTHLAKMKIACSELRALYPNYVISKNKIQLDKTTDKAKIFEYIEKEYSDKKIDKTDGLKIYFEKEWVHLRESNTEPIIRIYAESQTENGANTLAKMIMDKINSVCP